MIKIAVSGIGGVGGYFGGLLAKEFQDAADVEIYFIARGENEKVIHEKGLQVNSVAGNFTAFPKLTTSDTYLIGAVDLLICCTKSYDLTENLLQCAPCIDSNTVLLPLQNGVNSKQLIAEIYPENLISDGCVYIISRLTAPGIITESGHLRKLFFGSENNENERLKPFLDIFTRAGIEAVLSENIREIIWEKFVFISVMATLTTYLDEGIGNILADPVKKNLIQDLLSEIKSVADKSGVNLPENISALTLDKMYKLPVATTSSMHSDFQKPKQNELESLTGYVVNLAKEHQMQVPTFERIYGVLRNKKAHDATA